MDAVSDDAAILTLSHATQARAVDRTAWDPDVEAQIIARAKADRRAFAAIYRAYYPGVVGYLYRRVGDEHLAEDLAAETFIKAMNGLRKYEPRGLPLKAWLLRIATNEAHRWARRRNRRRAESATTAAAQMPARDGGGADRDEQAIVVEAFLSLSVDHQDVLALHHLESMGVEQVALVLRCRVGTVKSRLARAREAMRRELERRRFGHD